MNVVNEKMNREGIVMRYRGPYLTMSRTGRVSCRLDFSGFKRSRKVGSEY